MSPTPGDLRALLERRAEAPSRDTGDGGALGARLAGVRARVRHRRRVRTAATALAVALVAGSATVTAAHLRRPAVVQPAAVVDGAGRPLVTTLRGEGVGVHDDTVTLAAGWANLHLVTGCTGSPDVVALVLVDGRQVAEAPCGGPERNVVVSADQARAWRLPTDQPVTVGLHLARAASPGHRLVLDPSAVLPDAHGRAAVFGGAPRVTLPQVPDVMDNPGAPTGGDSVLLSWLTLPVTKDFATRSFTVMSGAAALQFAYECSTSRGAPGYVMSIAVNGHWLGAGDCGESALPAAHAMSWPPGPASYGLSFGTSKGRSVGVAPGRPSTISVRLSSRLTGDSLRGGPDLARDLPGALVGIAVRGTPDLTR